MTEANVTRRELLRWTGAAAALHGPLAGLSWAQPPRGPLAATLPLNEGWTFAADGEGNAQPCTLPHTVVPLSWHGWEPESWQKLWQYHRSFAAPVPPGSGARVFLHFDAAMSAATATLNGQPLPPHAGGFLPFEREITTLLKPQNELTVAVDGRWINTPPSGGPKGFLQIDYLLPAGLIRNASLRVVPSTFLADVFARPVDVLTPHRALEILCTIDSASVPAEPLRLHARLLDGSREVGKASQDVIVAAAGQMQSSLRMTGLAGTSLWSPETPRLYTLEIALQGTPRDAHGTLHTYQTRVGFREVRFTVDGLFVNGVKSRLFGVNRHEHFPFTGFAMPDRVQRNDARLIRGELNCNAVRCSHYPQSEAFLDACDELGLMVWEEPPGWQYLGDEEWQARLMADVETMIRRDRNHPSVVIWGVRVNESHNDVALYTRTKALANRLDGSRPTSGSMTTRSAANWVQDVFAYDDYHSLPDGSVGIYPPTPGVPFMNAEAVGQWAYEHANNFKQYYRRAGEVDTFAGQARFHAQAHDRAAQYATHCGLLAWSGIDYCSRINGYNALKCTGVLDLFRVPKLGAAFYQSQVAPGVRPVIAPAFFWDAEDLAALGGTGWVFSNCEQMRVTVGSAPAVKLEPARAAYPKTAYPPFQVDLRGAKPGDALLLEGLMGGRVVLRRQFSQDRSRDQLVADIDDRAIKADGSDATRAWFTVADEHGAAVRHLQGAVAVTLEGPGELVGDRSFDLAETGGDGAVWVRGQRGARGTVRVTFTHPAFAATSVSVAVG